jgi:hypothetical protein
MKASPEVCDDSDGSEDAVCITPARRFERLAGLRHDRD